jgi:hypothetical protein
MHPVTDDDPAVGDAVHCGWVEHDGERTATGKITEVSAAHVTVLLDTPLPGRFASKVAFPHHSDVPGLRCRRTA